jgi:hypothetical protein
VRHHGVEKPVVAQGRIAEPQLLKRRSLFADHVANANAHALDQLAQKKPRRRGLEILDDMRLDPGVSDQAQGVARGPALRVVVDDHVHDAPCRRLLP